MNGGKLQELIRTKDKFTVHNFMNCVAIIKSAYPQISPDWFDMLREICVDENLTELELTECTKSFIKNVDYPSISKFLNWKKEYDNLHPVFKL